MNRHLFAITKTLCTKSVFTFIFLLSITGAKSQPGFEKGLPFITNYTSKIYNGGPASWSVIQDDNGIMYFGNINPSSSILKYDGVHWNKIPAVVNSVITRCFEKDKNGVIYYGGYTDFGYLFSDSTGKTAEYSLLKYIPKNKRGFTDIWTLQIAGNDIYFQARERLFRLTKTTDNKWIVKTWEPSTHFMYTFYLDGVLYVHEQAKGLLKMVNDTLILIPGSEFLGKERMQVMLPYRGKMTVSNASNAPQYLIGTFSHGLYIFDGKNFKPFATSADSFFKKSFLYKALQIGGDYALSIPGHGVVFINPQGKITQIIDKKAGLQSDVISDFFEDKNGNLWMALDNGIAKANLNSPFTQYNSTSGISASPFDMARLPDGSLYVGTNNGLLRYDSVTNKFVLFDQIPLNQIFNTIADGNTLLVSGNGLDMIKDGKVLV
ncbi:MAG TPA: two-component regulator propeller domain-containing protein, partial [Hanamia sp.]